MSEKMLNVGDTFEIVDKDQMGKLITTVKYLGMGKLYPVLISVAQVHESKNSKSRWGDPTFERVKDEDRSFEAEPGWFEERKLKFKFQQIKAKGIKCS